MSFLNSEVLNWVSVKCERVCKYLLSRCLYVLRVGQNEEEQVLFSSLEGLEELKVSWGSQVGSESSA